MSMLSKLEKTIKGRVLLFVLFCLPIVGPMPFLYNWLYSSSNSRMQGDILASIALAFAGGAIIWGVAVLVIAVIFLVVYSSYSYIKYGPRATDTLGPR